jgi:hypothetical protein
MEVDAALVLSGVDATSLQDPAVEQALRTNVTAAVAAAADVSTDNVTINNITAAGTAVRRRSVLRTSITRALLQSSLGVQVDFTVMFEPILTNLTAVDDVTADTTLPAAVFLSALQAEESLSTPSALQTGLAQYGSLTVASSAQRNTPVVMYPPPSPPSPPPPPPPSPPLPSRGTLAVALQATCVLLALLH